MKTKSFLLGAAALMLATACSNDEVVNVAPQAGAIGFNSFVGNSTRTDYDSKSTPNFKVYGVTEGTLPAFQVFSGDVVSYNGTGWAYTTDTRYWIPDNKYTFAAVAPSEEIEEKGTVTVTQLTGMADGGITEINFKNNGNVDLLFDAANNPTWGAIVPFTLKHLLSRVKFQLNNKMGSNAYAIKVSDLKITGAMSDATYTPASGEWKSNETDAFEFAVTNTDDAEYAENDKAASSVSHNLVPEAKYAATFTITLYQVIDGKYTQVHAPYKHDVELALGKDENGEEKTFQAGYSYTFVADVTKENIDPKNNLEPIVFSATVEDWTEQGATLPTQKVETTTPETPSEGEGN